LEWWVNQEPTKQPQNGTQEILGKKDTKRPKHPKHPKHLTPKSYMNNPSYNPSYSKPPFIFAPAAPVMPPGLLGLSGCGVVAKNHRPD
jgi:hypothetical protein